MAITADGYLDWAERMPGRPATGPGFNAGVNGVRGLVFHSAEGFATTMLSKTSQWGYYSAQYPWHLSNLLDGRLIQHYPFTARCWHGSAFNDEYVGMENEGRTPDGATIGPVLNDGQVSNARRVIASLSQWKGWTPKRPTSSSDKTATLWQHGEVTRFGGSATQCPSSRIPWPLILSTSPSEDNMIRVNAIAPNLQNRLITGTELIQATEFSVAIPTGTKRLTLEVYLAATNPPGVLRVLDFDGKYAGQVGWAGERYGTVDVLIEDGTFILEGNATLAQLGVVAA